MQTGIKDLDFQYTVFIVIGNPKNMKGENCIEQTMASDADRQNYACLHLKSTWHAQAHPDALPNTIKRSRRQ